MTTVFLGIGLATAAAFALAVHFLCIRKGTTGGTANDAVLVVMIVNIAILVPLVAVFYYPAYGLTTASLFWFVAAGLAGTMVGQICLYQGIDRIGANRSSPIQSTNALIATLLGVAFLGERLTATHGLGVVLVVGGVAAIAWETAQGNGDDGIEGSLLLGMLFPFGAAVAFGVEPIFATLGMEEGTPAPVGLALKTVAATLGFVLYLRLRDALPAMTALTSVDGRWFVLGGVGHTLFLLGYYVALSLAPVSIVMPFIITTPVFVVVLSWLFMPQHLERVTWPLVTGTAVVAVGSAIIVATA